MLHKAIEAVVVTLTKPRGDARRKLGLNCALCHPRCLVLLWDRAISHEFVSYAVQTSLGSEPRP